MQKDRSKQPSRKFKQFNSPRNIAGFSRTPGLIKRRTSFSCDREIRLTQSVVTALVAIENRFYSIGGLQAIVRDVGEVMVRRSNGEAKTRSSIEQESETISYSRSCETGEFGRCSEIYAVPRQPQDQGPLLRDKTFAIVGTTVRIARLDYRRS